MPDRGLAEANRRVIDEFRARGGNVGGYFDGMPLLLLTTIGASSGRPRTVPLTYMTDGDRYVVVAAAGGAPADPAWHRNLLANPAVRVEVGTDAFDAIAVVATSDERARLLERFLVEQPQLGGYQRRTSRPVPVVVLERSAR